MRAMTPQRALAADARLRISSTAGAAGALRLPRAGVLRPLRAARRALAVRAAHEAPSPSAASPPPAARALPALAAALRAAAPVVRRLRPAALQAGPPDVSTGGEIVPASADLAGPGAFGIPQRWLLVAATSAAFVLCNMDKVRAPAGRHGANARRWACHSRARVPAAAALRRSPAAHRVRR
jgi:hypothetical protein